MTESDNRCPECDSPVDIWDDNSIGLTVNFRCLNFSCLSGKGPWDTPPPPLPRAHIPRDAHATLRRLKRIKENYNMRIGLARAAGADTKKLERMRESLKLARKAFLAERETMK